MKNILKSVLDTTDNERIEALEELISSCPHLTDIELSYIDFIMKSYTDIGQTPTLNIMLSNFPELENSLPDAKYLEINDLLYSIKSLINQRKTKIASLNIMDLASKISNRGITENDIEALREFIPDEVTSVNEKAYDFRYFKDKYIKDKDKPTGLITNIAQVDELIGGCNAGTVTTILAYTSQFKCVSQDEYINTTNGMLKIKDIYRDFKQGKRVQVLSEEGFRDITHVHFEGVKDSIIVNVNGRNIETSPIHRFRVYRHGELVWVMAKDLVKGDKVALKYEEAFGTNEGNVDLYYLLGCLVGDGGASSPKGDNYDYQSEICIGVPESKLSLGLDSIFNNLFKTYSVTFLKASKKRQDSWRYRASLNQLRDSSMKKNFVFLLNKNSDTKSIPKELFTMNKDCVRAFLQGYFDTDGSNSELRGNYITLSSNSYNALLDVSRLLSMFCIQARIIRVSDKAWRLQLLPKDSKKFLDEIGFRNILKQGRDEYITKTDMIPCQEGIYNYLISNGYKIGHTLQGIANPKRLCVNRDKLIRVMNEYEFLKDIPLLKEIFDNDLSFGDVMSISKGKSRMFDLTVEGSPTYIVNGCVTHNTTLACNMAYHNSYNLGYNIAVISLEMPREDYLYNILGRHSVDAKFTKYPFVPHGKIRHHDLSDEEEEYLLNDVLNDLVDNSKGMLFVLDETDFRNMSYTEIRETLYRIDDICMEKTGTSLDAIVIDHAHLLKFTDNANSRNKSEAAIVNDYISFFRRLTQKFRKTDELDENGNPVYKMLSTILLAQSNRTGFENACKKKGEYSLLAIAEFNEIERASYRVLSIWTDDVLKASKEAMMCVLKNRGGSTQYVPMSVYADGESYVFGDIDNGGVGGEAFEIGETLDIDDFSDLLGGDMGLL